MLFQNQLNQAKELFNTSLGFDLGSSFFRIWQPGKGIVAHHPHVIAINKNQQKVVAVGEEALEMRGKVPDSISIITPFDKGVMTHYTVSEGLFRYLFHQMLGKFFLLKPLIMVSTASDATPVERQAISEAMFAAGARQVYLIDSPLAAAIGAGIPVAESNGNIVVHIGGGIMEVAVISLGSIVMVESVRTGSNDLDKAIQRAVRKSYSVLISTETAQAIKEQALDLRRANTKKILAVKGKDIVTGHPKEIQIEAAQIVSALEKPLKKITQTIQHFLEHIPPELASDVIDKGVILTGGGAKLQGLDFCFSQIIGVPVSLAEHPELCVIKGVGLALENLDLYRQSLAFEVLG